MTADIHTHGDILIGSLPLNHIDEDGCRWIVQDVTGWWETPPAIIPEDERPYHEDGNYWTAGRYGARTIQITGAIVPPPAVSERHAQEIINRAREKMNKEINLVRRTGILTFHEVDATRQIEVQLLGQPLIATSAGSNTLHFDLQFMASDPRKRSSTKRTNTASLLQVGVGGRKYPRVYPRKYSASRGTDRIYVVNDGDTISYGKIRITGPITDPRIDHASSGDFFKINITLGPQEYLDIDMENKTVVLNGQDSKNANLDFESTWFPFQPGDNTLLFSGVQPAQPQEGWEAATNLVHNPSAERVGTDKVVHRNIMPDPSFTDEDTLQVTTRRNIAPNPTFDPQIEEEVTNLVTNPSGRRTSGTVTVRENLYDSRNTNNLAFGSNLGEDGVAILEQASYRGYSMPVQPGDVYTITRGTITNRFRWVFTVDPPAAGSPNFGGPGMSTQYDNQKIVTIEVPEGAGYLLIYLSNANQDLSGALIERGAEALPYFDGDTSPDTDLTPEWVGTPGASTSRLVAPRPTGWLHHPTSNSRVYYSARNDSLAIAPGAPTSLSIENYRMPSEGRVTFYVEAYSETAQQMQSGFPTGSGPGSWGLPAEVWTEHRRFHNVPANSSLFFLYQFNPVDTIYFRSFATLGEYAGPYFDGDDPDEDPVEYVWHGEENNSENSRRIRTVSDVQSNEITEVLSSASWSATGDYSLKITPLTEDNNTYADITPAGGIPAGQRYTISATMYEPTIVQGDLHQYARGLVISHSEGVVFAAAPIGGGRANLLTSIPAEATNIRLYAYNGSAVNTSRGLDGTETVNRDSIYWDELTIIPGETQSSFFYHETPDTDTVTYTLEGTTSVEKRPSSRYWTARANTSAYIDQFNTSDLVIEFVTGAEVESSVTAGSFSTTSGMVTLGALVTTPVDTLITPYVLTDMGTVPGTEQRVPANTPTYVRSSIPAEPGNVKTGFTFSRASGTGTDLVSARLNAVLLVDGRYEGPYFDMDTGLAGFDVRQAGAPIEAYAFDATGYTASPQAVTYRSSEWAAYGQYSLAVQRADTTIEVDTTYAQLAAPVWSALPNGAYTMFATVFAQPGAYKDGEEARSIEVYDQGVNQTFRSAQAPMGENTLLTLKFTKSTNSGHVRFISNALDGEKVFWDGILIVSGDYSDRYFDGDSDGAVWTGVRFASTSTQTSKLKVPAATLFTEHRDSWIR